MLTTQKNTFISTDDGSILYYIEGTCLSTDTKPTDVANGSILIEMDTSKVFMFDADNVTWREQSSGGGGGGGGSSDFSTAEVTFTNETNALLMLSIMIDNDDDALTVPNAFVSSILRAILYKGKAIGTILSDDPVTVTTTGDAEYADDTLIITGNCTITIS